MYKSLSLRGCSQFDKCLASHTMQFSWSENIFSEQFILNFSWYTDVVVIPVISVFGLLGKLISFSEIQHFDDEFQEMPSALQYCSL